MIEIALGILAAIAALYAVAIVLGIINWLIPKSPPRAPVVPPRALRFKANAAYIRMTRLEP